MFGSKLRLLTLFALCIQLITSVTMTRLRNTCTMGTVVVFGGTGLLGRECVYQVCHFE